MRGKVLLKLDLSVVQNGSTWRIGDGHQVRIRGDKWLPDKHSSRIISPQRNLPSNALVCSFIDEMALAGLKTGCALNFTLMRPE